MKKRKPPVVLATCLIIMVAAVALMYSPARQGQGGDQPEQPQAPTEEQARPTLTSDQTSSIVKQAMKPGQPGGPRLQKPGMPGSGNEPSIKMSRPTTYKPTPNDSSTSTQWYTNETPK